MREIKTWRDPYEAGFTTCRPKTITIEPGLTVLVGCNGAGKTTLLQNIKDQLRKAKVPVATFDNLSDGKYDSMGWAAFNEQWGMFADMFSSSEGENISISFGRWANGLRDFIITGKYKKIGRGSNLSELFMDDDARERASKEDEKLQSHDERWLLLDATDSGYSVDNVIELKDFLKLIEQDAEKFGKTLYVVITANEYELARGERCMDVNTGKYVTFSDYEEYRKHIIESRKRKDKRIERLDKKSSDSQPPNVRKSRKW